MTYTISNLTKKDIKMLQFVSYKNEQRLSNICQEVGLQPEIKKIYRDELKKNKQLSNKLKINLY